MHNGIFHADPEAAAALEALGGEGGARKKKIRMLECVLRPGGAPFYPHRFYSVSPSTAKDLVARGQAEYAHAPAGPRDYLDALDDVLGTFAARGVRLDVPLDMPEPHRARLLAACERHGVRVVSATGESADTAHVAAAPESADGDR